MILPCVALICALSGLSQAVDNYENAYHDINDGPFMKCCPMTSANFVSFSSKANPNDNSATRIAALYSKNIEAFHGWKAQIVEKDFCITKNLTLKDKPEYIQCMVSLPTTEIHPLRFRLAPFIKPKVKNFEVSPLVQLRNSKLTCSVEGYPKLTVLVYADNFLLDSKTSDSDSKLVISKEFPVQTNSKINLVCRANVTFQNGTSVYHDEAREIIVNIAPRISLRNKPIFSTASGAKIELDVVSFPTATVNCSVFPKQTSALNDTTYSYVFDVPAITKKQINSELTCIAENNVGNMVLSIPIVVGPEEPKILEDPSSPQAFSDYYKLIIGTKSGLPLNNFTIFIDMPARRGGRDVASKSVNLVFDERGSLVNASNSYSAQVNERTHEYLVAMHVPSLKPATTYNVELTTCNQVSCSAAKRQFTTLDAGHNLSDPATLDAQPLIPAALLSGVASSYQINVVTHLAVACLIPMQFFYL